MSLIWLDRTGSSCYMPLSFLQCLPTTKFFVAYDITVLLCFRIYLSELLCFLQLYVTHHAKMVANVFCLVNAHVLLAGKEISVK